MTGASRRAEDKRRSSPPRETHPTRPEPHPALARNPSEHPPQQQQSHTTAPPLASSAGHRGAPPFFAPLPPPAPSTPETTRHRLANHRTVHRRTSRQLTFVAESARRGLQTHPGHPTTSRDAGASRKHTPRYAPPGVATPITCFRLYAPNVRSPRHSAPPHAFTAPSYRMQHAPRAQRAGAADPTAAQFAAPAPAPISSSRQPRHCARPLAPQQTGAPIASAHAAQSRK